MSTRFIDGIIAICEKYVSNGYYVGNIPEKKLINARSNYRIPNKEAVFALVDTTVFGSAKIGLAICSSGLYWKNDWGKDTDITYLPWQEFKVIYPIELLGKYDITIGEGNVLGMAGCSFKREELVRLLAELQEYVAKEETVTRHSLSTRTNRVATPSKPVEVAAEEIDIEGIMEICERFSGTGYYVLDLIPDKRLQNAVSNFPIPSHEEVIALVDATVFGSAKNGLAICTTGVYWKNDWATETRKNYLSWGELTKVKAHRDGPYNIKLGEGNFFNMAGSAFKKEDLVLLLEQIQRYVRNSEVSNRGGLDNNLSVKAQMDDGLNEVRPTTAPIRETNVPKVPPLPDHSETWMLALEGQQYGPYEMNTIEEMLRANRFEPKEAYLWKQGMTEWKPFLAVPEFTSLIEQWNKEKTISTPPPLPGVARGSETPSVPTGNTVSNLTVDRNSTSVEHAMIDINTANVDTLVSLPSINLILAKKIIQERERRHGFKTMEEVGDALQLKPHQLEKLRHRVKFSNISVSINSGRIVDF